MKLQNALLAALIGCCLVGCSKSDSKTNTSDASIDSGAGHGDSDTDSDVDGDSDSDSDSDSDRDTDTDTDTDLDAGTAQDGGIGGKYAVGSFVIEVTETESDAPQIEVTHETNPDKTLFETASGVGFAVAAVATLNVKEQRGSFQLNDKITRTCDVFTVSDVRPKDGDLIISGNFDGNDCGLGFELKFSSILKNQLGFELKLVGDIGEFNRVYFRYGTSAFERFFGFGEQFTHLDLKGRAMPIIVQEQGIGRGAEPITSALNLVSPGSGGSWYSTYTVMPYYVTSEMRSLFLENKEVSHFDLQADDVVEIKLMGTALVGRILNGDTPLELIEEFTEYSGRMPSLPDWMNQGAIIGMQGGTDEVLDKLAALKSHDTPIGGFWLQDWVGKRDTITGSQLWWNWELNDEHYPNWTSMSQTLKADGIRVLTYVNPFLVNVAGQGFARNLFLEAKNEGYLILAQNGGPYLIPNTDFSAGMVDLTNPDARDWMKSVIKDEMLGIGASGWMADFAEALPFDCVLHSGEDAAAFHNAYAEQWAALNREVIEEEGLLGEAVFFSRSGYTTSPGKSTLFWLGDQLVSWDKHDGLKSAIKGMLSSGISGISLNHSDIGGYTNVSLIGIDFSGRTKELLLRWMEANAFTAVFRTHEGINPDANIQFYDGEDTYTHLAKFAKVYKALAFYREELMQEAADHGWPIARHMLLHYPDDPNVWDLEYQWMLGTEFIVAPVVNEGRSAVDVYLPKGEWINIWDGIVYGSLSSSGTVTVTGADLGKPPVLYKSGSEVGATFLANLTAAGVL